MRGPVVQFDDERNLRFTEVLTSNVVPEKLPVPVTTAPIKNIEPSPLPVLPSKSEPVGVLNKLGDFVSDVGKGIAYGVAAPINSITGHKYDPKLKTKAGKVLVKGSNIGHDSLHIAPKAFADAISGGAATKLANKLRKDENKESAFNYTEMRGFKNADTGVKSIDNAFDALEKVSKTGAAIGGMIFAGKSLAGAGKKAKEVLQGGEAATPFAAETKNESSSVVPALIGVAGLLLLR